MFVISISSYLSICFYLKKHIAHMRNMNEDEEFIMSMLVKEHIRKKLFQASIQLIYNEILLDVAFN